MDECVFELSTIREQWNNINAWKGDPCSILLSSFPSELLKIIFDALLYIEAHIQSLTHNYAYLQIGLSFESHTKMCAIIHERQTEK